jgi:capsular polysaccharide biosynthesis protein
MDFKEIIKLILEKKWLVFWLTVLGAVLAFDLMVIQEPQYKAVSRILVIQKQAAGQDIYTISKSAQYLTGILKEGVYSDSFFEKILESDNQLKESDFPALTKERREQWQKDVKINIVRDLGVMEISVFNSQQEKAGQISQAITQVLEKNHQFYHGAGDRVELKVLDQPLVSQEPITLGLWIGTILGGLIGFLAGLFWVLRKKYQQEASFLERVDYSF